MFIYHFVGAKLFRINVVKLQVYFEEKIPVIYLGPLLLKDKMVYAHYLWLVVCESNRNFRSSHTIDIIFRVLG